MRWILAGSRRWSKTLSNSESQTIEAELGTAMSYFPTASRKCLVEIYLHVFTIFVVSNVIITRWFFILRIVTFFHCTGSSDDSFRPDSL